MMTHHFPVSIQLQGPLIPTDATIAKPINGDGDGDAGVGSDGDTGLFLGDLCEISRASHTALNENFSNDRHHRHHHHLDEDLLTKAIDPQAEEVAKAVASIEEAIQCAEDDPGVLASESFNKATRLVREHDAMAWFRLRAQLKKVSRAAGVPLSDIDQASRPEGGDSDNLRATADALVALVRERAELFHAEDGACFATLKETPRKTYRLDTTPFSEWLSFAYFQSTSSTGGVGCAASETAIRTARVVLSGIAKHEGPERKVYLRVARHDDAYYLDLGDDTWRAIEITASGWQIVDQPPVQFWRSSTARPLPLPALRGDLSLLWQYANLPPAVRTLVLAWMLEALRPETPFPILELIGSQGSAKSSTQDRLRDCLDPNAVNLRSAPKSVEDLFVSAGANWLVSLNNLSHLSASIQDAICNLATGGGFAARTLYTNSDETLIEAKRPVILNGIVPLVTAQDLTDRLVHVELSEIGKYRAETEIRTDFERDRPLILGGLLDLFVRTLRALPQAHLDRPPRMADFVLLGEAMMLAEGHPPGTFHRLYQANRRDSVARGLEASPVAVAIRALAEQSNSELVFTGNFEQLRKALEPHQTSFEAWPKSSRGLSDIIRRQQPALAQIGISITIGTRTKHGTQVTVKRTGDGGDSHSETCSQNGCEGSGSADKEVF